MAYDFSDLAELALDRGIAAALGHPHADLHVLGVLDDFRGIGHVKRGHRPDYHDAEKTQAEITAVVQSKIPMPTPNDLHLYVHARIGDPASHVLALAAEAAADVIIVGTHGRQGMKRWLLGSVAERVVRYAHCPVLVVRPLGYHEEAKTDAFAPEPPCPACVARREQTQGAHWWCEAHEQPHERAHRYSYQGTTAVDTSDHSNSILW